VWHARRNAPVAGPRPRRRPPTLQLRALITIIFTITITTTITTITTTSSAAHALAPGRLGSTAARGAHSLTPSLLRNLPRRLEPLRRAATTVSLGRRSVA
jgi:hypothetical protein